MHSKGNQEDMKLEKGKGGREELELEIKDVYAENTLYPCMEFSKNKEK